MKVKRINIWIFCIAFLLLSCTEEESVSRYPVLGVDRLNNVRLTENRSGTLLSWAKKDIKDVVLLHVNDESSLGVVPYSDIERLRAMISVKNWKRFEDIQGVLFNRSNYLYIAGKLGMIDRVYWVLPYSHFTDIPLAGRTVKKFLHNTGNFSDTEIDAMKMEYGCLNGRLSGMKISIFSPRTLPFIKEPVVMDIDAGFFPLYADELQRSKLSGMKRCFDEMAFRKMQIIQVDIAFGTDEGHTKAMHRFIGDELFEGIANPEILSADSPPDLWKQRDMAENMLSGGEDIKVVEYLAEPLKLYPEDIPLKMLSAAAKARAGEYEESFNELSDICDQDIHYCYGFVDLGNMLAERNNISNAEKFFQKGLESLPEDPYVISQYAAFLKNSGREAESDSLRRKSGAE